MLKNILLALYIMLALCTAFLTMNDAVACYNQQRPNSSRQLDGAGVGLNGVFTGVFWPITLPGMIAVYDQYDGLFCS